LRPVLTACLLAGATLLLYSYRLPGGPANAQEKQILVQAQSGSGPLFFRVADDQWLQPLLVYATAIVRTAGGGDEAARIATAVIASLNVALIFLCARRVFDGTPAAFVAALLLLVTPAHVAFGRSGTDAIVSVPFALLWLYATLRFWTHDSTGAILTAGAVLGAGVYSNRAAPLTMGFLLGVSLIALTMGGRRWRAVLWLLAAFSVFLIPAAAWFAVSPGTYPDTFGRWVIHLAHVRDPLDGMRAFVNWNTLGNRVSLYWRFLDPAWLFFENMFLLVMLPLLAAGLAMWRRVLSRHVMFLVAGGAMVTPLAGSSFGELHYAADAMTFVPFAILLMTAGAAGLQSRFSARTSQSGDTTRGG
jgi:4-amino-4-deoxy-L-arabinose transferase-like glycosyltransferase